MHSPGAAVCGSTLRNSCAHDGERQAVALFRSNRWDRQSPSRGTAYRLKPRSAPRGLDIDSPFGSFDPDRILEDAEVKEAFEGVLVRLQALVAEDPLNDDGEDQNAIAVASTFP